MTILTLLFSLNSCVNPWIYLAFNRDLVRVLWLLVRCQSTSASGQVLSVQSGGSGSSPSITVRRTCFTDLGSHMPGPATAIGRSRSSLDSWKIPNRLPKYFVPIEILIKCDFFFILAKAKKHVLTLNITGGVWLQLRRLIQKLNHKSINYDC